MADLRRRKPDDESGKQVDDDNFSASKPERCGDGFSGSDDEHQLHHRKPACELTTADSSDHVSMNMFICIEKTFSHYCHHIAFKLEPNPLFHTYKSSLYKYLNRQLEKGVI